MRRLDRAVNVADVRDAARRRLPRAVFEIIEGGNGDDVTLRRNRAGLDALTLRPRALGDRPHVDLATTILGAAAPMPMVLAPCSFARICHPAAEIAVARAAGAAGVEYAVPAGSSLPPEGVAAAAPGSLWFQIYLRHDADHDAALVERVRHAGYRVLCVTTDTPISPRRETDIRNRMTIPLVVSPRVVAAGLSRPRWAKDFVLGNAASGYSLTTARNAYQSFSGLIGALRPVTHTDIARLRDAWPGPLVVKGVLRHEDVEPLVRLGVDGVVVSNHGGRNLDGTPATIDVLPEVVAAATGRIEVLFDSGVRRGTDVVKALALGADAVLLGRPYLYGLAAGGEAGVRRVIAMVRTELEVAMGFMGLGSIADIDPTAVRSVAPRWPAFAGD